MSHVNSLKRGLQLLEAFTLQERRLSLQQMTLKAGLPRTTVFRILKTLLSLNYLYFDAKTKLYSLSPRVMSLGFTVLSSFDLREAAHPYLEELAQVSGQNINLGILDKTEAVFIECIRRRPPSVDISINLYLGSRLKLYSSSIGRTILAFMREDEFREILRGMLKDKEAVRHIGASGKSLLSKLEDTRRKGYALSNGEIPGLRAISAPVMNHKGSVEGAINMPVLSAEISLDELIERYVPLLLDTAGKISAARGFMK